MFILSKEVDGLDPMPNCTCSVQSDLDLYRRQQSTVTPINESVYDINTFDYILACFPGQCWAFFICRHCSYEMPSVGGQML